MSIGKACSRIVYTAEGNETVRAAAARMKEHNVGTLVVVDAANQPCGILTDRDLVLRVLVEERLPDITLVEDVMTQHPRVLSEQTPMQDALATMRALGVRRLPVVGKSGELVGLLSISDMVELLADELGDIGGVIAHRAVHRGSYVAPSRSKNKDVGIERAAGEAEC